MARRAKRRQYEPTHAVYLYDGDIDGVRQGWRQFHLLRTGRKFVHVVECARQKLKRVKIDLWNKLVAKGKVLADE